ncbi:MAG: tetratricopeptide repeat protein [Firmicutes bacterium]|nr:tetratricopeptide repeat protein [Bacillota bacterium]
MNSAEVFSKNVKSLLKRKGMKFKELAECIDLSASYLSLVLNNCRGNLSDVYRDRIAAVLDTSVADLYTEVEEDGEDVVQIIDTQLDIADKERVLQLKMLEDALTLLENGHPDVRTAFYYGFGSLTEEEAMTVTRFLRKVVEKHLSLRENDNISLHGNSYNNFPRDGGNNGNENLREVLKKIQSDLPEDSRRVLALVAIAGDGCSLELLEELTGFDREIIEFHLRELAGAFLVEMEETEGDITVRFRDDTVYRVAYRLTNPARRSEIHRQVARFLEAAVDAGYEILARIAAHYQKAGCIEKTLEYSLKAAECAYTLKQFRHSLKHYSAAAVILSYKKQNEELARIYQRIGTIHSHLFNEEEALRCQDIALKLYRKCKDQKGMAFVLCEIGAIWFFRGETKKAIANYEKSMAILRNINEKDKLYGQILIRLGSAYGRQGELDQARAYYREARDFNAEKGYYDFHGQALTGLGIIALRQRNWEQAADCFTEALRVLESDSTQRAGAMALGNLGLAYLEKGDLEEAITTLAKSIELYTQAGDARYGAYASVAIAKAYLQKGDLNESLLYAEEVFPILKQARDEAEMAEYYRVIGHISRLRKEWRTAIRSFEESIRLFQGCKWQNENQKITEQIAQVYYDLGSTLKENGDIARGQIYQRKAYDFYAQYRLNIKYLQNNYRRFTPFLFGEPKKERGDQV